MGFRFGFLKTAPDLRTGHAIIRHRPGIKRGLPLRHGNALVVDDMDAAVKFIGIEHGTLAGTGKAARHGDMDDLIIIFEDLLPQVDDISGSRLGCVDHRAICEHLIKMIIIQILAFAVFFSVNNDRHGLKYDPVFFRISRKHAAVCICNDCYLHIIKNS